MVASGGPADRAAVWEQAASYEVATILGVDGTIGTNEVGNVGKTRRRGWDLQAQLATGRTLAGVGVVFAAEGHHRSPRSKRTSHPRSADRECAELAGQRWRGIQPHV